MSGKMINISTSCHYFLWVLLMNWYKLRKSSHFTSCFALQEVHHAIIYLFAVLLLTLFSPPTAPTSPLYIFLIGCIILHCFHVVLFFYLWHLKATLNPLLEGGKVRICLKQRMTESFEENLLRESNHAWPLRRPSMTVCAPGVSVASQTKVCVGHQLLKRPGGPRMSMTQLPITNRVWHRAWIYKQNASISIALLLQGNVVYRFYLMATPSGSTRKTPIYSSKLLIDNSPKLEITLMSINNKMEKEVVIDPQNGLLYSNWKEQTSNMCNNMDSIHREYVEWKKPDTKDYLVYDSTYTKFKKRQN